MINFLENWGTLIIAVLALVQPWVIALWRRLLRPGAIDIYETGTIEIGYSTFGPTIALHGTLRARDRDLFIRSSHLELVKEKDQSRHRFEWGAFRSPRTILGRPDEMTLELPSGFLLLTSQPHRYNIFFYDAARQEEIRPFSNGVRTSWNDVLAEAVISTALSDDPQTHEQDMAATSVGVYRTFSASSEHAHDLPPFSVPIIMRLPQKVRVQPWGSQPAP